MTREAGKGDAPRKDADQEAYATGWDRIFAKKQPKNEWHTCPYKEDLYDDHVSLCDCSDSETKNCADDI